MTTKQKNEPDLSPNERLLKAMGLTEQDIKMNRAGKISSRQRRLHYYELAIDGLVMGMLTFMFGNIGYLSFLKTFRDTSPSLWLIVFAALMAPFVAVFLLYRLYKKVVTGTAVAFIGRVRKHLPDQTGKNAPPPQIIMIDDKTGQEHIFPISNESFGAYIEGQTYTVYAPSFTPDRILSAEHTPNTQI